MFKNLTPEERSVALQAMKEKTNMQMKQLEVEHKQFVSNINHSIADLDRGNQALENINNNLAGKDAKCPKSKCNIL